jgi:predicted enzyme related to lactoylglutathione lyase
VHTMKIEVVPIPVSDPDVSKAFYVDQVGFVADHDHRVNDSLRFIQLTPPGSACSICFGEGIVSMEPGQQKGVMMVVEDVRALREELASRGVDISGIDEQPWGDFAYFSDPDGNEWTLQQLPPR